MITARTVVPSMQAVAVSLSDLNWTANVVARPAVGIAKAMKKAMTTSPSMKAPGIRSFARSMTAVTAAGSKRSFSADT